MFCNRGRVILDPSSPKGYRVERDHAFNRASSICAGMFGIALALMGPIVGIAVYCIITMASGK